MIIKIILITMADLVLCLTGPGTIYYGENVITTIAVCPDGMTCPPVYLIQINPGCINLDINDDGYVDMRDVAKIFIQRREWK